ncbi:FO synthase [Microbacterium sorbitolivorans]|uniref:7,8-didemethyl-8-hydroxy-5-deazariboflavin synthase n=1 Tax=Microbacterium sorbitolivorans TaxID=1867410 RepID=A0A367Y4E1_9MICO|nr:7,8-didemethyl-8-hydroxy-5-deazariboflavin synthase CofG [Microbacterium sorbitolivorans]RCK59891.1 7,8-didemethyl-8-hydroxy-5-deazariboflavin synthase subunit CofG [Microbacterium sorbitolivorans]GGF40917.1 FO synthase [Microbacterium sorbitolivorans]
MTSLAPVLDRAARGERLDANDAEALLSATGADFDRLLEIAGSLRDEGLRLAGREGIITYSRKVFIPLTTLCRDRCHYCVFVDTPNQLLAKHKPAYMSASQVLAVARQGQAKGCKEALLTLGDRPEDRWPEARAWLDEHGYGSTLEYVADMARLIRDETGLLPHINPGVMHPDELAMLRATAPSMGIMLETTSRALFENRGEVHYGSPDKDPALRLTVIDNAGAARIPFTTGILVGIGETLRDRAESMVALRESHERHGHIQEVIVQNFRAKPRTAMQNAPDAQLMEYTAAVAVTRIVMGPRMRIQVPPNLQDIVELSLLARAGADDWGGVSPLTADHVNPERPWPHLDDLAARTAELGFTLRERLTAHPEYLRDEWLAPEMREATRALADPATGLAIEGALPVSHASGSASGARHAPGGRATSLGSPKNVAFGAPEATFFGDPAEAEDAPVLFAPGGLVAALVERAAEDPGSLDDGEWVRLLTATGDELDAVVQAADDVRRYTVGEAVSLVANRNIASTLYGSADDGGYDLAQLADMARDAADLGLTEICVQGVVPGPAEGYLEIARAIKAAAPGIHLHAYRPQDVRDFADRSGLSLEAALSALREAGVDTVPGTGVKVLSERVRREVAPGDLAISDWIRGITAAHRAGFTSTSVMFYGHVETAEERIAHLRELIRIQNETGGFTEFVPIPMPGWGRPLVEGRADIDEHRAMVAVSRLMLSGTIAHIQLPWTRLGLPATAILLNAGGDDLGGTLLDGRVGPRSGVEAGATLTFDDARALVRPLFRPLRERTTSYGEVS